MSETTYSVVRIRHMYTPDIQGKGRPKIVEDGDNQALSGLSLGGARKVVADLDSEVYHLSNGEAGRPEYYVLSDTDAEYYATGRDGDGSRYMWYDWEDACESPCGGYACGECAGCLKLMQAEDVAGVRATACNAESEDLT